jgi:hypothetical protein
MWPYSSFHVMAVSWLCNDHVKMKYSGPGLPDGLLSNKKSQFGYILECLRMENAGKFYGHLEYFAVIWFF